MMDFLISPMPVFVFLISMIPIGLWMRQVDKRIDRLEAKIREAKSVPAGMDDHEPEWD